MIAIDTETTGIDFFHGARPYLITTCDKDGNTDWIWDVDPVTRSVKIDIAELLEVVKLIENADTLILQNAKFDYQAIYLTCKDYEIELNWPWERTVDTLIASHLLGSGHRHDLTSLALQYLGMKISDVEDEMEQEVQSCRRKVRSKKNKLTNWMIATKGLQCMPSAKSSSKDADKYWKYDTWLPATLAKYWNYPEDHKWYSVTKTYADTDSAITYALWQVMEKEIRKKGLWRIFKERMKVLEVAADIQIKGISRNKKRSTLLLDKYIEETQAAEEVCLCISKSFNYDLELPKGNKNVSLDEFCFNVLNLPIVETTPKGNPSLNESAVDNYLTSLPENSPQLDFVKNLFKKNKLSKSIQALEGYNRYGRTHRRHKNYDILHPSLNPTATVTLRWGGSNPNPQNICFSGDTEVLTSDGWVSAKRLNSDHEVAQYWKDLGEIDFVRPILHKIHHKGEMIHIQTEQQIDMLLTPDHRCLLKNRKTNTFIDVPAKDFKEDYKHIHAGHYSGGDKSLSSEMITLICATQADGSYVKCSGVEYGIKFAFKKVRKIKRLCDALDLLDAEYSKKTKDGITHIYIKDSCYTAKVLKSLLPKKQFGKWLLEYDYNTLNEIANEVFFWDGESVRKSMYSSSIKNNSDWIQILMTITNKRSNLVTRMPTSDWAKKEHHYLNVTHKNYSMTTNCIKERIDWNDYVYCVTVPSSYIIIRRNGKVSVTGNCKGSTIEWKSKIGLHTDEVDELSLRHCFGPLPGREWWSLDYQNIELRIPAFEAGETELMDIFLRPNDPPYYGSYHLVIFDTLHPELFKKHGKACKEVFKSTWYQWVKNGNFAIQYGAQQTKADATYRVEGAYRRIKDRFPKIAKLNQKMISMANTMGFVTTIPDKEVDPSRGYPVMVSRTEWGKVSPTTPLAYHVQSTAMWCTMKAMNRCYAKLKEWWGSGFDGFITMQVHDELVFDFPLRGNPLEEDNGRFRKSNKWRIAIIKKLMEQSGEDIGVPTPVGVDYHTESWGKGIGVRF